MKSCLNGILTFILLFIAIPQDIAEGRIGCGRLRNRSQGRVGVLKRLSRLRQGRRRVFRSDKSVAKPFKRQDRSLRRGRVLRGLGKSVTKPFKRNRSASRRRLFRPFRRLRGLREQPERPLFKRDVPEEKPKTDILRPVHYYRSRRLNS